MQSISVKEYLKQTQPSETKDQITLAAYLDLIKYDNHPLRYTAVPNGGKRDKKTAAILKMMGVRPGVPDILIFDSPPKFQHLKGAAIELKRADGGTVSDEQKDWLEYFHGNGWGAMVGNLDEVMKALRRWGYSKGG